MAEASGDPGLVAIVERLTPTAVVPPKAAPAAKPPVPVEAAPCLPPGVSLTSAETSRLESLSSSTREQVLSWLSSCDPILIGEARRRLSPAAAPRPEPATTLELLHRLREDIRFPSQAAAALSQEFDDVRSWCGFHRALERAWRGELPVEVLLDAYEQASGPRARNPGAIWNHVIKRWKRTSCRAGE